MTAILIMFIDISHIIIVYIYVNRFTDVLGIISVYQVVEQTAAGDCALESHTHSYTDINPAWCCLSKADPRGEKLTAHAEREASLLFTSHFSFLVTSGAST